MPPLPSLSQYIYPQAGLESNHYSGFTGPYTTSVSDEDQDEPVETHRAISNRSARKRNDWTDEQGIVMLICARWTRMTWKDIPKVLNQYFPRAGGVFRTEMAQSYFCRIRTAKVKGSLWEKMFERIPFAPLEQQVIQILHKLEDCARQVGVILRRRIVEEMELHREFYGRNKSHHRYRKQYVRKSHQSNQTRNTSTTQTFKRAISMMSDATGFLSVKDEDDDDDDCVIVEGPYQETNSKNTIKEDKYNHNGLVEIQDHVLSGLGNLRSNTATLGLNRRTLYSISDQTFDFGKLV